MIRAYCRLPGYDDVRFDATPWFEGASAAAIEKLVREEWSGPPVRTMARHVAELNRFSRLAEILAYRKAHRTDLRGKPHEIEIHVDPQDALAWLEVERPDVHARILAGFGDDATVCGRARLFWDQVPDPDSTNYARHAGGAPSPR